LNRKQDRAAGDSYNKEENGKRPWTSWKYYLIDGIKMQRISYRVPPGGNETCLDCGAMKNSLHSLGCDSEKSPCKKHSLIQDCDCPAHKGEEV
jgi:hypothetical protein